MNTVSVLFTRRKWNPVSWAIRWAMPRSRFAWALSSHAIVAGPEWCYEATMLHGVRRATREEALRGQVVVREVRYSVLDAAAAIAFCESQVGKRYDWAGAFGLGLAPGRDWASDEDWFCYEFAAASLRAGGRDLFQNLGHIGEIALLAINP